MRLAPAASPISTTGPAATGATTQTYSSTSLPVFVTLCFVPAECRPSGARSRAHPRDPPRLLRRSLAESRAPLRSVQSCASPRSLRVSTAPTRHASRRLWRALQQRAVSSAHSSENVIAPFSRWLLCPYPHPHKRQNSQHAPRKLSLHAFSLASSIPLAPGLPCPKLASLYRFSPLFSPHFPSYTVASISPLNSFRWRFAMPRQFYPSSGVNP